MEFKLKNKSVKTREQKISQNKPSNTAHFNEDNLSNYVNSFSFPRLAGSEGEKKAVSLTSKVFKEVGFKKNQIVKQPFTFSDFYSTTLMKFLLTLNLVLVLNLLLFSYIHGAITMVLVIFITMVVRLQLQYTFSMLQHQINQISLLTIPLMQ